MAWEDVEVPEGTFIGWGKKPGQKVTGEVLDYDETGGKDFDKDPCPLLTLKLTETAHSHVKGKWNEYPAGEVVLVTCGQPKLKQAVKVADPQRGWLIQLELTGLQDTANGEMKLFAARVDRTHKPTVSAPAAGSDSSAAAAADSSDDDCPF